MHELAEYLSRRYPMTFEITRHSSMADYPAGWGGATPIKSVRIVHLDEEFELPVPLPLNHAETEKIDIEQEGTKAMRIAGLLIQDDLALMVEGSDGGYYFMAGAIIVPGLPFDLTTALELNGKPRFLAHGRQNWDEHGTDAHQRQCSSMFAGRFILFLHRN